MVSRRTYRLDPKWLEPFVEPKLIFPRAKEILSSGSEELTPNQKTALEQFVKEFDIRERGENPDSVL